MEINHLDQLTIMDTNNTNASNQTNATQSGQAVPLVATRLSLLAIQSWLRGLNSHLQKAGRPQMSEDQIANFTDLLLQCGYSATQAKLAQVFILCGKWSNYREDTIQFEYFFPKDEDMRPFRDQFVPIGVHEAQIREIKRQFEAEKQRISDEMMKLERMYAEAVQEIRRLKLEPSTPPPPTDMDVEFKKISKLYLDEQGKRLESDAKIRRLQTENQQLQRKYNRALKGKNTE